MKFLYKPFFNISNHFRDKLRKVKSRSTYEGWFHPLKPFLAATENVNIHLLTSFTCMQSFIKLTIWHLARDSSVSVLASIKWHHANNIAIYHLVHRTLHGILKTRIKYERKLINVGTSLVKPSCLSERDE